MTMAGGATGGYWAIGNCVIATPPTTRMNSAITHAKIGRSMKNLAMRAGSLLRGRSRGGRSGSSRRRGGGALRPGPRHRLHGRAGRHHLQLLEAVDHHLLAGLQAVEHHPLVVLGGADL